MWGKIIYLRPGGRRPVRLAGYKGREDLQAAVPAFWCRRCGMEVYEFGRILCKQCERWGKDEKE